jgi:hypothetical protein
MRKSPIALFFCGFVWVVRRAAWLLDGFERAGEALGDGGVGEYFGDEAEYLAFARGEWLQRVDGASAGHDPVHDLRVDRDFAGGDPPDRVDESGRVLDSVLDEVAHPVGTVFE